MWLQDEALKENYEALSRMSYLRIILFDDLIAAGTPLRATRLPPLLELVVGPFLAPQACMPSGLASVAEPKPTVGALDHWVGCISGQVHKKTALKAVHALAKERAVVEVVEPVVLLPRQQPLSRLGADNVRATLVVHRALEGKHGNIAQRCGQV